MRLKADQISKRFTGPYIIKDFSFDFQSGEKYGIEGPNGSGKSTLIKILSGYLAPTKGHLKFFNKEGKEVDRNDVFRKIAMVAPYIELDMELTPDEIFQHLKNFKTFGVDNTKALLKVARLEGNQDKELKYFSSGMMQRFCLSLAFLSDAELLLLDEPSSFLDDKSKEWTNSMIDEHGQSKTMIIASNDSFDFSRVKEILSVSKSVNI